jgi:hypothetical protein
MLSAEDIDPLSNNDATNGQRETFSEIISNDVPDTNEAQKVYYVFVLVNFFEF